MISGSPNWLFQVGPAKDKSGQIEFMEFEAMIKSLIGWRLDLETSGDGFTRWSPDGYPKDGKIRYEKCN